MCDPNKDYTRSGYPRRDKDSDGQMEAWKPPFILMIDRGDCTFVDKARNAQKAGAMGVLIADNTCLCSAGTACKPAHSSDVCETNEPVMADDGNGADVTVPSFLVFKQDADPVKEILKKNQVVQAEMSWKLPAPGAHVDYELWTTPKDDISAPLKKDFRQIAVAMKDHAKFTPHFYIFDGIESGCQDNNGKNVCYNLCTNEGRYCATDPDEDLDSGISGAMVVGESLRQMCIWSIYGADGVGLPWWDYVQEFETRCDKPEDNGKFFDNEACIKDAMQHAKVDFAKVSACMEKGGGLTDDFENTMLEKELENRVREGILILPSFLVNQSPLRGAMTSSEVFEAICSDFRSGSEPKLCKQCGKCTDVTQCHEDGYCKVEGNIPSGVTMPVFVGSLAGVVLCFSIFGIIQWQRSQRQMRAQVRGIMAEYMPLDKNQKVSTVGFDEDDAEDGEQTFELS